MQEAQGVCLWLWQPLWQTADGKFSFVVSQGIGGWAYEDELRHILEVLNNR
jgi:hypothetical protein